MQCAVKPYILRSKHLLLRSGSLRRIVWAAAAQVAGSPCALQKSRGGGAQLVSLRRAGEQAVPDGAGEGCQGQQQVKQGLLKFYWVSELLHVRIGIPRPGGWSFGAKHLSNVEQSLLCCVL